MEWFGLEGILKLIFLQPSATDGQPDQAAPLIVYWKMFKVVQYAFTSDLPADFILNGFTYTFCFEWVYLHILFWIILSRGWGGLVLQS